MIECRREGWPIQAALARFKFSLLFLENRRKTLTLPFLLGVILTGKVRKVKCG